MSGKYLRGAFIELTSGFLAPVPSVIVFQYNPETITHSWTTTSPQVADGVTSANPLAIGGDPSEEFSFNLIMDAADTVADGADPAAALASVAGVSPRLASLELLMFPSGSSTGALLSAAAGAAAGVAGVAAGAAASAVAGGLGALVGGIVGVQRAVPEAVVPAVLFVWGPGRILPVRVTRLQVTETLYSDTSLVPTHAEVDIGLRVLTTTEIRAVDSPVLQGILRTAYDYMSVLRKTLAIENVVNSADSIIGMVQF